MFFGCLPCCGGGRPCECGEYAETVYCEITASLRDGTLSQLIYPICQDEISQVVSSSSGRYVLPWASELGGWSYFVENQAFIYFVAGVNGCSLTQTRIRFTGTVPQCFAFVESVGGDTTPYEKFSWVAGPFFSAIPETDCSFWQGDADRVFSFAQQNSILLNGSIGNVGGTVDVTVTLSTNPAP